MTDMLLELAVWIAGCLFLVMSESTEDLIVNSVAVNFIGEVDLLLLSCFFSTASPIAPTPTLAPTPTPTLAPTPTPTPTLTLPNKPALATVHVPCRFGFALSLA